MNTKCNTPNRHPICDVLASHVDDFLSALKELGYPPNTLCTKRAALRRFIEWRRSQKNTDAKPDESEVKAFMAKACKLDAAHRCLASRALFGFLEHLRRQGVIRKPSSTVPTTARDRLVQSYASFLRDEKGLAELSLRVYLPVAASLLEYLHGKQDRTDLRRLNASIIRHYLFGRAKGRSSEYVRLLAISLRSFVRFLHLRGKIGDDLTTAVPTVRKWSQPGVPKKLTPDEVKRVLAAPDRKTPTGRRDYAILLLLARLGLRAGEVITLQTNDLYWRSGEILIRGKGARRDVLPLPHQTGAAIAHYLRRDRGVRPTQRVFLRANAPRVPLTGPASIGHIVRRSLAQAGIERPKHIAAHLFRHTLASRMLQQGAQLRDIAEVLRHRAYSSSEIYAKIDLRSLDEVVRPWPGQGGGK
jgi:site-specific recombinase XerD